MGEAGSSTAGTARTKPNIAPAMQRARNPRLFMVARYRFDASEAIPVSIPRP